MQRRAKEKPEIFLRPTRKSVPLALIINIACPLPLFLFLFLSWVLRCGEASAAAERKSFRDSLAAFNSNKGKYARKLLISPTPAASPFPTPRFRGIFLFFIPSPSLSVSFFLLMLEKIGEVVARAAFCSGKSASFDSG